MWFRSDYFHNLRHLHLVPAPFSLHWYLPYFPFHQLECLALQSSILCCSPTDTDEWKYGVVIVVLPLDGKAISKTEALPIEMDM
jgi:hypothetical protein